MRQEEILERSVAALKSLANSSECISGRTTCSVELCRLAVAEVAEMLVFAVAATPKISDTVVERAFSIWISARSDEFRKRYGDNWLIA